MRATLVVLLLLLGQSATEVNANGESLLSAGRYDEALRVFRSAAAARPQSATAHFNQALAMAGLRRTAKLAGPRPSQKSVLDVVEVALKLDPGLRSRAEAELPAVRTTFRGQRLLGRTPAKNADEILQALTWRSRNGERLQFLAGGAVRYCRCRELETPPPPPGGQWEIDGAHVTVTFGAARYDGALGDDGVLILGRMGRLFAW